MQPELSLENALQSIAQEVEDSLDSLLPAPPPDGSGLEAATIAAMRYACMGGGKRLRPFLVVATADIFSVPRFHSLRVGTALEMVHSYSLVHDDLPAMDNSDMRRGKPSVHRKFGEATAILAGDALLSEAFAVLSDPQSSPHAGITCKLVYELAVAGGIGGMVGGQSIDITGEGKYLTFAQLQDMHRKKTGALLWFGVKAGGILGHATEREMAALDAYGTAFGLAFQIMDDILDVTASSEALGKPAGQDEQMGKNTFVSHLGLEKARENLEKTIQQAVEVLDIFDNKAYLLRELARHILKRGLESPGH